ncbi:MAG: DUF3299 domain-containing protein [Saprospiraceae bacterium]
MIQLRYLFLAAIIALGVLPTTLSAQAEVKPANLWKTLAKITYRKEYDEMMGLKVDVPVFSQEVQDLDGKEVEVKGFIIPVEGYKSHNDFILSAYPYSMCFFCGGAGPETVMQVTAKEAIKYSTDAITIKGILKLNNTDINQLMYAITEVELVKE